MPDREIKDAVIRHQQADMPTANEACRKEPSLAKELAGVLWDSLWDVKQYAALGAEWRRGLKDLQNVVLGPWGGTHEELGTIGNPTPQLITDQIRGNDLPRGTLVHEPAAPDPDFEQEMRSHAARIAEEPDQGLSIER